MDVLLGKGKNHFTAEHYREDDIDLYRLPRRTFFARRWLRKKNYDVYLSIEMTTDYEFRNEPDLSKKLIFWIQDPRPKSDWDEINTVKLFPETNYYAPATYERIHKWNAENRIYFISQAHFLDQKARELYDLPADVPIQYVPNPVDIDHDFDVRKAKKEKIIFLGRIESVKRGWLFAEIAKRMPQYSFYMLGQSTRDKERNSAIMSKYAGIPNLHFAGHVDGIEKENYLKDAKILVNTSIHEALPVSFLEALAYGTLLVSNRDPDGLTERFGRYVGEVLGDGFDKVDLYVKAINEIMNMDRESYLEKAQEAIDYVKENHNVEKFKVTLRKIISEQAEKGKMGL